MGVIINTNCEVGNCLMAAVIAKTRMDDEFLNVSAVMCSKTERRPHNSTFVRHNPFINNLSNVCLANNFTVDLSLRVFEHARLLTQNRRAK